MRSPRGARSGQPFTAASRASAAVGQHGSSPLDRTFTLDDCAAKSTTSLLILIFFGFRISTKSFRNLIGSIRWRRQCACDGIRLAVGHSQQHARRPVGNPATQFPVLNRVRIQPETVGDPLFRGRREAERRPRSRSSLSPPRSPPLIAGRRSSRGAERA